MVKIMVRIEEKFNDSFEWDAEEIYYTWMDTAFILGIDIEAVSFLVEDGFLVTSEAHDEHITAKSVESLWLMINNHKKHIRKTENDVL